MLSEAEADRAFRFGNRLYITEHEDGCLIERNGKLYLITKAEKTVLTVYEETGEPRRLTVEAAGGKAEVTASFALVKEETVAGKEPEYREYAVRIMHNSSVSCPVKATQPPACHQLYLEADYVGDRAEVYLDGKLADDWFTNGEKWHIPADSVLLPYAYM